MEKKEVEAMICSLSGDILSGHATEERIKEVTKLACEHNLSALLTSEFVSIGNSITESSD